MKMDRGRGSSLGDFSIGNDVVSVSRIASLIERRGDRFLERCFTPAEIRHCRAKARPPIHFAGRWAAKEAVYKALGLAWNRPFSWKEIEIESTSTSAARTPVVRLSDAIRTELGTAHAPEIEISLSISHCGEYAFATALVRMQHERSRHE